ncbi:primase-helicase family protein, partial [Novosphingobium sp. HII-3]|uniref:primase-helicase family protein n=1 Tax=Novosphingobium sp. HII-3 TaxID=2075565 RepID=UPI0018ECCFF4
TDDAWKAATCSTLWTIPKVEGTRFLPHLAPGTIITDELGRTQVNTYQPVTVHRIPGDPSPFLNHLAIMIPDAGDRRLLLDWMAHNIKYPGYKVPWAPVIQSAEGIGKNTLKTVLMHCIGATYLHQPKASDLLANGSKFNGWMKSKLMILVDEIKVDDRRDLIDVLKTYISETQVESQSKGVDQKMEDNYANWIAFTNHKDAVPVNKNGRRFAIFYSPLQSAEDITARNLDDDYFANLYGWLHADGAAIMAHWFADYQIERGAISMRAPKTTSWAEAIEIGLGPVARAIKDAVDAELPGFRDGWISTGAVARILRAAGRGEPATNTVSSAIGEVGAYHRIGQAGRGWVQDNPDKPSRPVLYHMDAKADVADFGRAQGYI